MKRYRTTLIYVGLLLLVGASWVAVSVWLLMAWWWIASGSVATFVACDRAERAITRRLDQPRPARRRAHARPRGKPAV